MEQTCVLPENLCALTTAGTEQVGYDKVEWRKEGLQGSVEGESVRLIYTSKDGEEVRPPWLTACCFAAQRSLRSWVGGDGLRMGWGAVLRVLGEWESVRPHAGAHGCELLTAQHVLMRAMSCRASPAPWSWR